MCRRLEDVADIHYGRSPQDVIDVDGGVPVLGTGGEYGRACRALFNGPAIVVPRKGSLGNPQYVGGPFWPADTTFAVIAKRGTNARWLYYCLDQFDLTKLNEATGVPSINRDWLGKIRLSDCGLPEQTVIGEIVGIVDMAIDHTEALIAKLQQIKAGLMHDLFTRGVLPNGELRPPREEAPQLYKESSLGWIPKEWEAARLSSILQVDNGIKPGPFGSSLKKEMYTSRGYRVYGQEQVIAGRLDIGNYYISDRKFLELNGFEVVENDVLLSLVGTIGKALVVERPFEAGVINPRLIRLRADVTKCSPHYLLHAIVGDSVKRQISSLYGGGTMPVISGAVIRRLLIPAGPPQEQAVIVERIKAAESSIAVQLEESEKLSRLKSGLMSDLLAGRVRIPESMLNKAAGDV